MGLENDGFWNTKFFLRYSYLKSVIFTFKMLQYNLSTKEYQ